MELIKLQVIPSGFILKDKSNGANQISIEYQNGDILIQKIKPSATVFNVEYEIIAVFGIIQLIDDCYLLVITEADPIVNLEDRSILKILEIKACNLSNKNPNSRQDEYFLKRIDSFIKTGFYFSKKFFWY